MWEQSTEWIQVEAEYRKVKEICDRRQISKFVLLVVQILDVKP